MIHTSLAGTTGAALRRRRSLFTIALPLLALLLPRAADALVHFDFEQAYYVHPGRQVWDFSLTRVDGTYHIFYHSILESTPTALAADTIWHATGSDLAHWQEPEPVLFSGSGFWDTTAIWAPDIFRDEANDRWVLAYTGADAGRNQRLGLAFSSDLATWTPAGNPVLEPDSTLYDWSPSGEWSDFRDPFVWRQDDQWHVLLTAKRGVGVLYHGVSDDLLEWHDAGPLFTNDGPTPAKVLESSQYHKSGSMHHLLFGEFDTVGISHVSAADPADLSMTTRSVIDAGYAPEWNEFDPGVPILSRLAVFQGLAPGSLSYVVRFDTLLVVPDQPDVTVHKPHPLDARWETRTGSSTLANPVFGDNPTFRGEPSVGLVGHGFFGSQEYYQGPLSGRGTPGSMLGGTATGQIDSYPFTVEGDVMTLRVGGGANLDKLYVALVDAVTGEILARETGDGDPFMDERTWDLLPFQGRSCRIRIVDASTESDGYINVDEIVESFADPVAGVPAEPESAVRSLRVAPNPCNPRTEIRFDLAAAGRVEVRIHDLRGRLVWSDGGRARPAGPAAVRWQGRDNRGRAAASGSYVYRVLWNDRVAGAGALSLVR